ncbi:DUF418 domain-containing protein [Dehalococcoidia bacterium]|nr:DUF418 domain-containing protein [Dehalococcoidia bacterium]MCL0094116.1 DUF418 domain-containing protein [Dehalococcoidia bacterium]
MTTERSALAPVAPQQRVEVLDIIRGVALFGILLVNMAMFRLDVAAIFVGVPGMLAPPGVAPPELADRVATWLIGFFAIGRFYPILAMLFGLGCYLIMKQAEQKGVSPKAILRRRLVILIGFGALHYVFIWWGDILHIFAVTGAFLLLFMQKNVVSLRKWIIGLAIVGVLVMGLVGGVLHWLMVMEPVIPGVENAAEQLDLAKYMEEFLEVFRQGSYWEVVTTRALYFLSALLGLLLMVPYTLIFFLAGFYAGRAGIVDALIRGEGSFRRILLPALTVGAIGMGIAVWIGFFTDNLLLFMAGSVIGIIGAMGFTLSYISALVLLARSDRFKGLMNSFVPVGRMPLTTYLTQSVVATSIFYGYGLGLSGQVGAGAGVLLTAGIFAGQMIFSWLWFKSFALGPAEWLWRRLMYGPGVRMRYAPITKV